MADLGFIQQQGIDYAAVPERTFTPLDPGEYTAMVTGSDMKPTSNNAGQFLELEITVIGGASAGRKLIERLNLINDNPKTVEIAYQSLKELSEACGLQSFPEQSELLHNKPFTVKVDIEEGKPYIDKMTGQQKPGSPQNRIKKYSKAGGAPTPAAQDQTQPMAATTAFAWNKPKS